MKHIGEKIQDIATEKGVRPTDLARKIGRTSQSMYDIYRRPSITTDLLQQISEALDHDFFQYYHQVKQPVNELSEPETEYKRPAEIKPSISITINNIDENKFHRIFKKINELIQ
jgi:hypothetical protein